MEITVQKFGKTFNSVLFMFTGLIETVGEITRITARGSGLEITVQSPVPVTEIKLGESIAVDGACLTVTGLFDRAFSVDVSPETVQRTTLGAKKTGGRVNLERALRLSDRLGGHIVSGHIDGVGTVASVLHKDDFIQIDFTASQDVLKYIIDKGSVAIDGISLTVNQCSAQGFSVMIIPHTVAHTTLNTRKNGDAVNIENDILGKYVEKLLSHETDDRSGITREFLEKFNFT